MLERLLRGLWSPKAALPPVAEFFAPEDVPGETLAAGCRRVAAGDTSAALKVFADTPGSIAHALRGALLHGVGDEEGARCAYAAAVSEDAGKPEEQTAAQHFYLRGRFYLGEKKPYAAARCLELAHRLMPSAPAPAEMLGVAAYRTGDTGAGERWYAVAIRNSKPESRGALRVKALIDTLPQIYESPEHVARSREHFETELDALIADPPRAESYADLLNTTPFFLNYQGFDDHALQAKLASLLLAACPDLGSSAPHATDPEPSTGRKLRVGFVSAYLSAHSVGTWYSGAVRLIIDSGRFDVSLFTLDSVEPRLEQAAARGANHVRLDKELLAARAQIAAARPDMLVYTDVQLHPRIYALGFARLAPLQCLLVGHPSSSGLPSMDYFLSNVFQDSDGAQAHYSEHLVRLPRIAAYVERTKPPARDWTREQLGFESGRHYYVCPMKLQKMHPDFDSAMARILECDDRAEVVLFEDPDKPLWREQLASRFARSMPGVADRVRFRRFAPRDEFLGVLQHADCVLDPFHFSGGVTTYNAFSIGVPVVTMAGELFRSRMTAGMYAQAGIEAGVARTQDEFVDLALRWAADRSERLAVGRRIVEAHEKLFETRDAVDQLADWLESAGRAPPTWRTAASRPETP
jgi:protein O-GlcNAc transferase